MWLGLGSWIIWILALQLPQTWLPSSPKERQGVGIELLVLIRAMVQGCPRASHQTAHVLRPFGAPRPARFQVAHARPAKVPSYHQKRKSLPQAAFLCCGQIPLRLSWLNSLLGSLQHNTPKHSRIMKRLKHSRVYERTHIWCQGRYTTWYNIFYWKPRWLETRSHCLGLSPKTLVS